MANFDKLKGAVANVIKANGRQEITGDIMQSVLLSMIGALGTKAQFAGVAVPGTNPGAPDGNVFYIATEKGTYANFGGITLDGEKFAVLTYDGTWKKQEVDTAGAFRTWLAQYTNKPGDTRLIGDSGKDVAFEVDAKADKVGIVVPTLNLIAPDDDPYKVTAATLPGATAQAAGVMTSEQVKNLGKALAKVGFAGNINFNDPYFYQDVEMAQGWYTLPEGLYTVEGEAFSGMMLITKSATADLDGGRNVIINSEPSFYFVGNAKFVTYDKADTDITEDVAKGDGFSVYTKMDATNSIWMAEFDSGYWLSEFTDIGNAFNQSKKAVEWMNKINQGWQNWQGLTNEKKLDNLPGYVFASGVSGNTGMQCTPTADSIQLTLAKRDLNAGSQEEVGWKIPAATNEKAGVMSAKDKTSLDTLASQGTLHDLFVAAGATLNKDGKTWTMNGITDLTTQELINAYQRRPIGGDISEAYANVPSNRAFRTNFPIPGWYNPVFLNADRLCYQNKDIEVLKFGGGEKIGDAFCVIKSMGESFYNAEKLRIIDGVRIVIGGKATDAFYKCPSLEGVYITGMNSDISFSDSPLLSKDSILYMITKANPSKSITVTLHPTAYAMATADTEIQAALHTQPLVSLAEGVPTV